MTGSSLHLEQQSKVNFSTCGWNGGRSDEPRSEDGDSGRRERLLGDDGRACADDLLYLGLLSPGGVVEEEGEGVDSARWKTDIGEKEGEESAIYMRGEKEIKIVSENICRTQALSLGYVLDYGNWSCLARSGFYSSPLASCLRDLDRTAQMGSLHASSINIWARSDLFIPPFGCPSFPSPSLRHQSPVILSTYTY